MKFNRALAFLIVIILLGFALRFWGSRQNSLYGDELTLVYDAYSILKTGHDENGKFLPLTFQMAEGRPAGYVYFSLPFVAMFGPSVLGARMLSVLSGTGIILLMFFLGRKLFNLKVGLAAATLTAISPWDIQLSSGGFETHFALFLSLLGVVVFLAAKYRPYLLPVSALVLAIALHTYSTYKLTVPLLSVVLLLSGGYLPKIKKGVAGWVGGFIAILAVAGVLLASQAATAGSEGRFQNINLFSQADLKEQIIQKVNFERSINPLPAVVANLFHNKNLEYGYLLGENYLKNFSPGFLFFHGDANPRHNGATMGELYLLELLFVVLGLSFLFGKKHPALCLLLPWLALAPIPAALIGEPHALRNSLMLPPLILFSSLGAVNLWGLLEKNNLVKVLVLLALAGQFLVFGERFYFLSPNEFGRFWSYPAKLASQMTKERRGKFDFVILSDSLDNIEFAYPVYARIDPAAVIAQNKNRDNLSGIRFKRLGNVYIGHLGGGEIEKFLKALPGSALFIGPAEEAQFLSGYQNVSGKDGLAAFVFEEKLVK